MLFFIMMNDTLDRSFFGKKGFFKEKGNAELEYVNGLQITPFVDK